MSARTLAPWQKWLDEEALQSGQRIVTTAPDQVIDDLEYLLDAGQLVLSDVFPQTVITDTSFATIRTYSMYTKDYADAASPATYAAHEIWVRMWVVVLAGGNGQVQISGGNGNIVSSTITSTTPAWYKLSSTYDIATHGTQVDIVLAGKVGTGGQTLVVDGLMIVAIDES